MPTAESSPVNARRWPIPVPWAFGLVSFLVYCLTLSHWASLSSLGAIARVSGWSWQPELRQPITCAVLYVFRLLPDAWLPLALNLFTAMCAGLVIALLARSVSLLSGVVGTPRLTKGATWAPAALAATMCGLQVTFWEHATAFSGEMLDLLIFAYVIRCLLEFRNDQHDSWLFRSALIYGAGITNNWALIGYLPLFLIAVLLVKGFGLKRVTKPLPPRKPRRLPGWLQMALAKIGIRQSAVPKPVYPVFKPVVFDTQFFAHIVLWGLAGLSFYLLLPLVQSLSPHSSIGFWSALKANLRYQKNYLLVLRSPTFRIFAIASLLPILVLVIGWTTRPANSGYETRRGIFLNRLAAYPLHASVLFAALWLSFDPTFSPRHLAAGVPMLTYYYLCAIMVGYCADYFLKVGDEDAPRRLANSVTAAICALAMAMPVLLAFRNVGGILVTNGPSVHQFARELYEDLPAGKSVVLGNDPAQLSLLRVELARQHYAKDALVVEMPALGSAEYHVFMKRKYAARWPVVPPTDGADLVGPIRLPKLIAAFSASEPVVYLDPTFGTLFDRPADSMTGFVHHFAAKPQEGQPGNEQLWQQRWTNHLQSLADHTKARPKYSPQGLEPLLSTLRLQTEPNATASFLGAVYAKSLNTWGVESQRLGHWEEAGAWFQRSLELNPENLCAHINLEYNEHWQRGDKARLNPSTIQKQFGEIFARQNDWREVLSDFGPVDEPTFLFRTGRAFLANRNTRLAGSAFQRSSDLAPDWPAPKLWLAQSLIDQGNFAEALKVSESFQQANRPQDGGGLAQLLHCRATALQGLGRTNEIAPCIQTFVREDGKHLEVLAAAADAYAQNGLHEQQLAVIEDLLKREPNRPEWLDQKGLAELQLGRYESAIATLTTALSLAPTDDNAHLSRAVARLGADQLDAARDDYLQLLNSKTCSANALFGLGTIAWRKQETNTAIAYYQGYLTNATTSSPQAIIASQRLRDMRAPKP